MKFVVNWSIDQENWLPILEKWSSMTAAERADGGPGVTIVGRWHDMASRTGVAILEATDAAAVTRYICQWNPVMDIICAPCLDDEESAAAGKAILEAARA
jgi:hypothetical protein